MHFLLSLEARKEFYQIGVEVLPPRLVESFPLAHLLGDEGGGDEGHQHGGYHVVVEVVVEQVEALGRRHAGAV